MPRISDHGRGSLGALALCALLVGLLHGALAARWLAVESRPPAWDHSVHLGTALDYAESARAGRLGGLILAAPRPGHPPYPPLYHYSLIPFLSAEQPQVAAAALNLAYLTLLLFSCAWLAFQLGGPLPAAAALLVLGTSAQIIALFREVFPDLAMAAFVALCYALILRSERFERRGWAVAAGFCAGAAMLSKWSAFVYLIPGAAAGLLDRQRRRNLAWALAACAALSAPWYAVNGFSMLPRVWNSMNMGQSQGRPPVMSLNGMFWYPKQAAATFGLAAALLMAAGAALALAAERRKGSRWYAGGAAVVAGWFLFSCAAWTMVPNKDLRYFLPALAALPALGLSALPRPWLALAAVLAGLQLRTLPAPRAEAWPLRDILETAESRSPAGSRAVVMCVLPNHAAMNSTNLTWLARKGRRNLSIGGHQAELPEWSEFVLLKTGDPGPFLADRTRAIMARVDEPRGDFRRVFRQAGRWPLPDGSEAVLFELRPDFPALKRRLSLPGLAVRSALLSGVTIAPAGAGRYEIDAESLRLEKLDASVRGLKVTLEEARLADLGGRPLVAAVRRARLTAARLTWSELSRALSARAHLPVRVGAAPGGLVAGVSLGSVFVAVEAAVESRPDVLVVRPLRARIGALTVPLPAALEWRRGLGPRPPYQPYAFELAPLRLDAEGLSVAEAAIPGAQGR